MGVGWDGGSVIIFESKGKFSFQQLVGQNWFVCIGILKQWDYFLQFFVLVVLFVCFCFRTSEYAEMD